MDTFGFSEKQIKNTFVLQQDQKDCGVACLLSLIELYGGENSLETLRELSGTSIEGTTMLGLYQAANKVGFTARGCESDLTSLIAHREPVILHVVIENKWQHYVVCYGFHNNQFVVGDPAKGICYYSKEELLDIWKSKTCLVLTPNDSFIMEKEERIAKNIIHHQ